MSETRHNQLRIALQSWLADKIEGASNVEIADFKVPDAGASNETLLFEARYFKDDQAEVQSLVARLQPTEAGVFTEYDLEKQYRTMDCLKGTGIKVPSLIAYEPDSAVLGTPFYVMGRLPGRVIIENPPYHMEGWFKDELSDEQRAQTWANAVDAIAEINRQDWQALGMEFLQRPELGDTPLQQQLKEYRDYLAWVENLSGRTYPLFHTALEWLETNQPANEPTALCWGDAKTANLLVDVSEVTGVLDWEMVHLGNPVHDIAWWMTLDNSFSDGMEIYLGEPFPKLGGLQSREELLTLWQQKSGFSVEHIDYYELLCAFKFAVIMTRLGFMHTEAGIMPPEMDMEHKNTSTLVLHKQMQRQGLM